MEKTLFIIRHAVAEDREVFARNNDNDDLRPLTQAGVKKMTTIAKRLHQLENIDLIFQSPLTRSEQTAQILAEFFPRSRQTQLQSLAPSGRFEDIIKCLNHYSKKSMALIGHEPHLSSFLSFLLTGQDASFINLKKGSIAKLTYINKVTPKKLKLNWLVTPKIFAAK